MCSDQHVKHQMPHGVPLTAVCYMITTLNNTYIYIQLVDLTPGELIWAEKLK